MVLQKDRQLPLWDFSLRYVHLLKQLFESGVAAEMGGGCFLTWTCLRCYTDFHTGKAYPTVDKLSQILWQTRVTTHKHLVKLEEMGLVKKEKTGKRNLYSLIDKFSIMEEITGNDETEIEALYVPVKFGNQMDRLKAFKNNEISPTQLNKDGVSITMPQVIVNNFYIQGDGNAVNNLQVVTHGKDDNASNLGDVMRQLIEQRDSATNPSTRQSAITAIRMLESSMAGSET